MDGPDPIDRLTRLSARPVSRRWRVLAVLIVFVLCGGLLRDALGVEWSTDGVRALVAEAGAWGPLAYVVLLVFRLLLVIPSVLLLPAGGLLFGAVEGSVYGAIGLTLSGVANYGLVRWAGPEAFRARISPRFLGVLTIVRSKAGAAAVAVISGYPIGPITVAHFAAAIAGMGFVSFLAAVSAGSLVRSATFSLFGASLVESDRLAWALAVMAGALVLPLLVPRSRAWLRQGFGMDSADPFSSEP